MLAATSCGSSNNNAEQPPLPVATAVCEGVTTLEIDSATTLITLRDNAEPSTQPNRLFYGKDNKDSAKVEQLSPSGSVPSSIHAFLVKKDNKLALFDTGNGIDKGGKLLSRLDSAGYEPENIDYIILTHMHGDHIGGLIDATGAAVFPKATLHVAAPERDHWQTQADRNGVLARKVLAAYAGRVKTFAFGEAPIPGVTALDAAGHTPGHTVYETESFLIVGDLLHAAAVQFPRPEISSTYDVDPTQAAATRRRFYARAAAPGKTIAGMHLPYPGLGTVAKDGEGFRYVPAP